MERRDEREEFCLTDHLKSRWLNLDLHRCWIDDANQVATVPLYNLSGQMNGYQKYNPFGSKDKRNSGEGKYYTFGKKDTPAFWGLESWNFSKTLFVTEGMFDAARLTNAGLSAIALLSSDLPATSRSWFHLVMNMRKVVMILDGDEGGKAMRKYGHNQYVCELGEDVSSLSQNKFDDLLAELLTNE